MSKPNPANHDRSATYRAPSLFTAKLAAIEAMADAYGTLI